MKGRSRKCMEKSEIAAQASRELRPLELRNTTNLRKKSQIIEAMLELKFLIKIRVIFLALGDVEEMGSKCCDNPISEDGANVQCLN